MEKEGVSISKVARVIPRRNSAFSRVVPRTAPGRDAPRHLARARGARPRPRHRPTSASVPSFNSPGFKTVETVGESWENGAREDEAKAMRYHGTRCYKDETKLDAASLARSLPPTRASLLGAHFFPECFEAGASCLRPFFLLFLRTLLPVAVLFLTLKPDVLFLCLFVPPVVLPKQRLAFACTERAPPLPDGRPAVGLLLAKESPAPGAKEERGWKRRSDDERRARRDRNRGVGWHARPPRSPPSGCRNVSVERGATPNGWRAGRGRLALPPKPRHAAPRRSLSHTLSRAPAPTRPRTAGSFRKKETQGSPLEKSDAVAP